MENTRQKVSRLSPPRIAVRNFPELMHATVELSLSSILANMLNLQPTSKSIATSSNMRDSSKFCSFPTWIRPVFETSPHFAESPPSQDLSRDVNVFSPPRSPMPECHTQYLTRLRCNLNSIMTRTNGPLQQSTCLVRNEFPSPDVVTTHLTCSCPVSPHRQ